MNSETVGRLLLVSALALSTGTVACESEQEREADAREDAADAREELLDRSEEDAPDSAAEMKEDIGVKSMEDDEAESPKELREKLDLHPEEEPE